MYEIELIDVWKLENVFYIFYQRTKVSPEARRLAKYKEKKKQLASRRYNSTLRLYANTVRAVIYGLQEKCQNIVMRFQSPLG